MAGAQFWRESERESLCCWAKIAQEFLLDQMWRESWPGAMINSTQENCQEGWWVPADRASLKHTAKNRRAESQAASWRKSLAVRSLKEPLRSPLKHAPEKDTAVNTDWPRTSQSWLRAVPFKQWLPGPCSPPSLTPYLRVRNLPEREGIAEA